MLSAFNVQAPLLSVIEEIPDYTFSDRQHRFILHLLPGAGSGTRRSSVRPGRQLFDAFVEKVFDCRVIHILLATAL